MDDDMYLRSNLEHLLKQRGSNPYRLQTEANIPQPTIQRILAGETDNPRQKTLKSLSEWSGYSIGDLLDKDLSGKELALNNAELGPRLRGLVPVINEVQAGAWADIKTDLDESEFSHWIHTVHVNSRYAFALRVVGDSMVNASERRSLNEGMIVVVDPEKEARHRSIVVARLEHSDKATIKELVIDGDNRYLRPFNPQYPLIPIAEDTVIVGTVVSASLDLT